VGAATVISKTSEERALRGESWSKKLKGGSLPKGLCEGLHNGKRKSGVGLIKKRGARGKKSLG